VKPLLVLLSVALNGAFVAGWLSQTLPAKLRTQVAKPAGCTLFQKLGLSETQLRELEPRLAKFRATARAQCREIGRLRRQLIDLLAAPEPCREAIRAKQKEILEGQRKMQDLVVEQLLAEKSTLTPEQQRALFDLIRSECSCADREEANDCCDEPILGCGSCLREGPGGAETTVPQRRAS
jgi:Spy/CpxP family protein refolding chaperone